MLELTTSKYFDMGHIVVTNRINETMKESNLFEWLATKSSDFVNPPNDWETTKYEQKALKELRKPIYLSFVKK